MGNANSNIPPTDVVLSLKKQGMDNSKIVQTLQNQGYNPDLIYDALTQAEVKEGVEGEKDVIIDTQFPAINEEFQTADNFAGNNTGLNLQLPTPDMMQNDFFQKQQQNNKSNNGYNQSNQTSDVVLRNSTTIQKSPQNTRQYQDQNQAYNNQQYQQNNQNFQQNDQYQGQSDSSNTYQGGSYNTKQEPQIMGGYDDEYNNTQLDSVQSNGKDFGSLMKEDDFIERIEEIAEAIVDEKWNEVVKTINKIIDWKDRMETKIDRLDQQFADLKEDFKSLSNSVVGKVGEYDKNISKIGIEIQAMEKVFQKVLPSLTENIHELQKITEKVKEKDGKF